jgi:hypothetical protein
MILSNNWDTGKVLNDDIYKMKQMNKIISRLTLINLHVINEKGITIPFRNPLPSLEI